MKRNFDLSGLMDLEAEDNQNSASKSSKSSEPLTNSKKKIASSEKVVARKQKYFEKLRKIFEEDNRRTKELAGIKTRILKGLLEGSSIEELFLLAVRGIAIATQDKTFLIQIEGDLEEIYGNAFGDKEIQRMKLKSAEDRLSKLKTYALNENLPSKEKFKIKDAIKAHEEEISELKKSL